MKTQRFYCDRCGKEIKNCLLEFEVPGHGTVDLCEKCEKKFKSWLKGKRKGHRT